MSARKTAPASPCPCGSGSRYKDCCAPYHKGASAPTPEALMRSRFSAYATGDARYIINTTHPESPYIREDRKAWYKELKAYVAVTDFLALRVYESSTDGDVGYVRFQARLMQNGADASFEENSRFERLDGVWLYVVKAG